MKHVFKESMDSIFYAIL